MMFYSSYEIFSVGRSIRVPLIESSSALISGSNLLYFTSANRRKIKPRIGSAYSVDFKPELARSWSAVVHNVSFQFFNCLLVIYFLHIGLFLNQHFPFSISFSVHSTDIILFLQGLHNSFYGAKRFSCLCHKLFLLNGRILVNQFQNCQFF